MSVKPPPDDIEELPLDLFGAEPAGVGAVPPAASPVETPATPPPTPQPEVNLRTWAEAGLEPGVDLSTGLPRRLRRVYDGFAIFVLWVLAGIIYGGISLHGRMFWLFFLAAGLYIFLMRLNKGQVHQRFHLFLDGLRKRPDQ